MDITKNVIAIYDKCAKQYQDKFMDADLYHDTYDLFCQAITKHNATILELACGPGNITKYLLQQRPDFKILATDLSAKMLELAAINNPTAEFRLMDCRAIDEMVQKYDALMVGFCLPYLSKEEAIKLIGDASGVLKAKGVLYLSTMEDDYSKSGFEEASFGREDKLHIYYHQADYLTKALKENGFKILDLRRKNYLEQNGTNTIDLVIIAEKTE